MACGRRWRVGGVGARHPAGSGTLALPRHLRHHCCSGSAPELGAAASAPPPPSLQLAGEGSWRRVRVGGVGARVDPAQHPLRGRTRASLLTYPGWAPPRYPPRRGARSICIGGGEEGSSRATSRGPRPGPREPRKSEAAARASGGAAGAGASARAAAELRSCRACSRSVWLATLQRAALAMCQLPRPWRSRNARRSCARAEAPVAPEQARAAATHKRATNSMLVPGSFAARFTTEALFSARRACCSRVPWDVILVLLLLLHELKVNKFQRDQQLPESHATSHGR